MTLHSKKMLFGVSVQELQKDVETMKSKAVNPASIAAKETAINNIIDYYEASEEIIKRLESIVSLQQAQLKIITLAHKTKQANETPKN
jgi:hypothetical protein